MPLKDTIVGLATPSGTSALAVIRLSGKECDLFVEKVFDKKRVQPRHAVLTQYRDTDHHIVDQVIYTFYAENASYTGEAMLEISCHGNLLIVQKIIKDLIQRGCRMAEPGEFTRRAFLNGKMDLSQTEAVIDIIHARSEQALQFAQRQLQGSLAKSINSLVDSLLDITAVVEAYIDFPEEDLPKENKEDLVENIMQLTARIDRLIQTQPYGDFLKNGAKVVLIGSPNAGKSSLLNKLVEKDRALVDEMPGTTRDFIEERVTIGNYPISLIDTAGLRLVQSSVEQQGMARTIEQACSADLLLLVIDSAQPNPELSSEIQQHIIHKKCVIVENKIDLSQSHDRSCFFPASIHCRLSALTGQGIDALKEKIKALLEKNLNLSDSDIIIVNTRHAHALEASRVVLAQAAEKLRKQEPSELIASDLREALRSLGEITGAIDNEKVLDKVFQNFCIGK